MKLTEEQMEEVRHWDAHDELASRWDREGWVGWNGGKCPVRTGVEVDVRYRNGTCLCGPSEMFVWWHCPTPEPIDVIAYWVLPAEMQEDAA